MNADPTSLDRLHDVVTPPAVPWWPPAPAWDWLLGAAALALIILAALAVRHWLRNRYRREALVELSRLEPMLMDANQRAVAMPKLAELLKRTALSAWPRDTVAALTGPAWQTFLDGASDTAFFSKQGARIEQSAYDHRASEVDETSAREIAVQVRHWITRHRVQETEKDTA